MSQPAPSATAENGTRPEVQYTQEVRFAVVMYGGSSLAIYMNGVAQELLRLVRAGRQAVHQLVVVVTALQQRLQLGHLAGLQRPRLEVRDGGQGEHGGR